MKGRFEPAFLFVKLYRHCLIQHFTKPFTKSGSDHGKDAVSNIYLLVVAHYPKQSRFALLLEML